jgi:hypothetical protein
LNRQKNSGAARNACGGAALLAPSRGQQNERADAADGAPSASIIEGFLKTVERIEKILDLGTQMLEQNKPLALHDLNHKKSHGLLELRRAIDACRSLDRSTSALTRAPLARLREKLERNLASLQTHLKAVTEIVAIITRAIQDHESDGTYSISRRARDDAR